MESSKERIMETVDDLINDATDPRETKRAIAVKMLLTGLSPQSIAQVLNVSEQYVSNWKRKYEKEGTTGLRLAYHGKASFLSQEQGLAVVAWIKTHSTLTIERLRDYLESDYGVVNESKQSYYDLLAGGGMSYHGTSAANPAYAEEQVMEKRAVIKKK
jgi:putative transposase